MRNATIAVLLLLAGCDDPAPLDAGAPDAGLDAGPPPPTCVGGLDAGRGAMGITRGCAQEVVTSGFGVRFDDGAHPIARWGAHVRLEAPEICDLGTRFSGLTLVTDLDPGAGDAVARVTYSVIGEGDAVGPAPDAGPEAPPIRVARGRSTIDVTADAPEVTVPALFDLAAAGFADAPALAVVLDGVAIDTDVPQDTAYPPAYDPADGYALGALGASVGDITVDGTDLRFEVGGTLAWGASGDDLRDDAAAVARAQLVVRWAVVALEAAPTTGAVAYAAACRPDGATTALAIDGPAGARAAPALTSFLLEVRPDEPEGAFLGELAVLVDAFAHDEASGRATMEVEGFASGPGDVELPTRFAAEVALLTWSGGDEVEPLRYARAVESGVAETPLPIAP